MRFGLLFLVLQTALWFTTAQAETAQPKSASDLSVSCTLHSSDGEGAGPASDCDADPALTPPRSTFFVTTGFCALSGFEPSSAPSTRNPDHLIRGPPAQT